MAESKYFVSSEGQQQGPFTVNEIFEKVRDKALSPTDYLYDEGREDWISLMEHDELAKMISEFKPKAPPKPQGAPEAESTPEPKMVKKPKAAEGDGEYMNVDWYVLKGENKFGPFAYPDVLKMLQEKVVFEFDFAWHSGLETWVRIAELEAFSDNNVKKMKDTLMPEIKEVFFRRRHRRARYGGTIIVHDNKKVWKGKGVEISAGGAGVVMENALLVPGQMLYLHFKPGDGVPPFNAICEVVSKRFEDGVSDKNAPIHYGLKFKSISTNTQKFLQEFTKSATAA